METKRLSNSKKLIIVFSAQIVLLIYLVLVVFIWRRNDFATIELAKFLAIAMVGYGFIQAIFLDSKIITFILTALKYYIILFFSFLVMYFAHLRINFDNVVIKIPGLMVALYWLTFIIIIPLGVREFNFIKRLPLEEE